MAGKTMQNLFHARICVELYVAKPLLQHIWIGETKENGFMKEIMRFAPSVAS